MPYIHFAAPEPSHHRHRHDAHHQKAAAVRPRPQKPERVEPPDFRFLVELGLVLRSHRHSHKTVTGLLEEISDHLTRAGVQNHVASGRSSSVSSREWTIASELCIPSRPKDHHFGVKLVSPFLRFFKRPEEWQNELRAVFSALDAHFELTTTHQCFTHIHLAPSSGTWSLTQAKGLAKSALYFERCLDALVPPYRRRTVWAKSNRNNHYFVDLPMAECFARVDAQTTFEGLAARLNWTAAASPTGAALGARPGADFTHDGFRWSFAGLNEGNGRGTVAFRQPPGATCAAEAMAWVMLVGCLARLSCGAGGALKPTEKPRLSSLGEWLSYEAEWCALPRERLLRGLLEQAVPVTHAPGVVAGMDATAITIDEDQRLRWKEQDRDFAMEKYRRLLKHL